jgi:hypothetical protein
MKSVVNSGLYCSDAIGQLAVVCFEHGGLVEFPMYTGFSSHLSPWVAGEQMSLSRLLAETRTSVFARNRRPRRARRKDGKSNSPFLPPKNPLGAFGIVQTNGLIGQPGSQMRSVWANTFATTTRTGRTSGSPRTRQQVGQQQSAPGLEARFNPCRDSAGCTIVMQ